MGAKPWLICLVLASCASHEPSEVALDLSEGRVSSTTGLIGTSGLQLAGSDAPLLLTDDGSPITVDLVVEVPANGVYRPELRGVTIILFRTTCELQLDGTSLGVITEERERRLAEHEPPHVIEWPPLRLSAGPAAFRVIAPNGELAATSFALVPTTATSNFPDRLAVLLR